MGKGGGGLKFRTLLILVLLLGACSEEAVEPSVLGGPSPSRSTVAEGSAPSLSTIAGGPVGLFASSLVEFGTCQAYLDHVKAFAVEKVGPYGFGGEPIEQAGVETTAMAATDGSVDAQPDTATAAVEESDTGSDFSGTNVQEIGVDEPDVVKTDGSRMLTIGHSGLLHYIDLSSGSPELRSSLPPPVWKGVEVWGQEIFMRGDTALLMSVAVYPYPELDVAITGVYVPSWMGEAVTLISEIDISDADEMRVVSTLMVEADFLSARLVGERVALVMSARPDLDSEFVYPASDSESARARAEATNRAVIEESTIEQWVPRYELRSEVGGDSTEGFLVDCTSGYAPQEFSGFDTLSVLTFDLSDGPEVEQVATVMSGGDTVYASTDRLYVASHTWNDPWNDAVDEDVEGVTTEIHRFDISGPDGAVYEASGSVDGFLLNQFAMSEHDGYLRVASTDRPSREDSSESRVDVLERDGRELRVVGSVGDLGRGEQIFAVRFIGETGYVVTFRQTDPLYTIDLSDPLNPEVLGELKILGYSAYLHPIGDGLLLGVGQDADEQGRIGGTQLSIFDVSDLADPVRIHQLTFAESTKSEIEYDHHAFLYWPPRDMVVIPIGWWEDQNDGGILDIYEAVVLTVGVEGIEESGRIRHVIDPDPRYEEVFGFDLADYYASALIFRSVVVGETLFTLSVLGLQGSDLDTLSETSWVPYPLEIPGTGR